MGAGKESLLTTLFPRPVGGPGPALLLSSQAALGRQTRHLSHLSPLCRAEHPEWAPLGTCHKVSSEAQHSETCDLLAVTLRTIFLISHFFYILQK